jgi:DNA repair protein RadC
MEARSRLRASTVARATPSEGATRAREDRTIDQALRILEQRLRGQGPSLSEVTTCGAFFRLRLGSEEREHFEAAFLNTRHQLIAVERLFSGTVDGAEVHPRIVVQRALALNASAVLLAHNHPSGHAEPSAADRALTARLKSALGLVEVRLLDHFVVTAGEALSMAARGWV